MLQVVREREGGGRGCVKHRLLFSGKGGLGGGAGRLDLSALSLWGVWGALVGKEEGRKEWCVKFDGGLM